MSSEVISHMVKSTDIMSGGYVSGHYVLVVMPQDIMSDSYVSGHYVLGHLNVRLASIYWL